MFRIEVLIFGIGFFTESACHLSFADQSRPLVHANPIFVRIMTCHVPSPVASISVATIAPNTLKLLNPISFKRDWRRSNDAPTLLPVWCPCRVAALNRIPRLLARMRNRPKWLVGYLGSTRSRRKSALTTDGAAIPPEDREACEVIIALHTFGC